MPDKYVYVLSYKGVPICAAPAEERGFEVLTMRMADYTPTQQADMSISPKIEVYR